MKSLLASLQIILGRRDSCSVVVISTLIFFGLLLLTQNIRGALTVFSFDTLSFFGRSMLFITTLFDIQSTFTGSTLLLAVLGSLLGGINISLAYTYMKIRGELIMKSGLYSGVGLVLAFLGIGCAACGTAFLSVLLGFFGFSAMLQVLPYQGEEIGYIGLIFLCIATYVLAKKLVAPNVC